MLQARFRKGLSTKVKVAIHLKIKTRRFTALDYMFYKTSSNREKPPFFQLKMDIMPPHFQVFFYS